MASESCNNKEQWRRLRKPNRGDYLALIKQILRGTRNVSPSQSSRAGEVAGAALPAAQAGRQGSADYPATGFRSGISRAASASVPSSSSKYTHPALS